MRLKGPRFPSYTKPPEPSMDRKPNPNRSLPEGREWTAHTGSRAKLRHLRQTCRPLLETKDPEDILGIQRLKDVIEIEYKDANEFVKEYGFLYVLFQAQEKSDDSGVPAFAVIDYIIDTSFKKKDTDATSDKELRPEQSSG